MVHVDVYAIFAQRPRWHHHFEGIFLEYGAPVGNAMGGFGNGYLIRGVTFKKEKPASTRHLGRVEAPGGA